MKSLFFGLVFSWATSVVLAAALTPDQAVQQALERDPGLAAARWQIQEAQARRQQSGRWSNPEFEAELRPNTNGREGSGSLAYTQRFPLTARLRREREVSEAEVALAVAEVREVEWDWASQTAGLIADWLAMVARLDLASRQRTNAEALASALQSAARVGEASAVEAQQLQLEAGQTAMRRRRLEPELARLRIELHRRLVLPEHEPLELRAELPTGTLTPPKLETVVERPEVGVARARLEVARRETHLARAQRWSDLGVGLLGDVQRAEDQPMGQQTDEFVGLRVALPLPFWNRNQGRIQAVDTQVQRRGLELQSVQRRVRAEAETAQEGWRIAVETEREWRENWRPLAQALEDQLQRQKAAGQASFTDWARARERRLQAEAELVEARHQLLRAWLQLQSAAGHLPRFPALP